MRFYLTLYFILILFSISFTQNFNDKIISTILVIGNETTEEDIIKREMLLNIGDTFNDSLRVLSEKRLTNLFLFNYVEIIPVPDNQNVSLLINVTERFYLYPFPELRIEDRDWDKLTYGFGMAHVNFRGRNEKIVGLALFGYRPGFQLEYFNPWIGTDARYTNSIAIRKYSTLHKVRDFDEDHFNVGWTVGRYWDLYFYNLLSITYDRVQVPRRIKPEMLSGNSTENMLGLNLSFNYDNRDLTAYPSYGWFTRLILYKEGFIEPKIDYFQYLIDIRHYHSFGDLTLAGRVATLQTIGDLPIYRNVYFGFSERLRGHFSEVYEGRHSFMTNIEARFPILPARLFDLPSLILPPSATRNLKFGLNAAIFYDTGMVWAKKEQFKTQNFLQGFGVGLHFLLPYVEVARLELAYDIDFNSEIIFEIGTAL